jgi:hypothetical protein
VTTDKPDNWQDDITTPTTNATSGPTRGSWEVEPDDDVTVGAVPPREVRREAEEQPTVEEPAPSMAPPDAPLALHTRPEEARTPSERQAKADASAVITDLPPLPPVSDPWKPMHPSRRTDASLPTRTLPWWLIPAIAALVGLAIAAVLIVNYAL